MDVWHWIFAFAVGALAGWSLAGYQRAGAEKQRGHLLRGLIAAAMACLFAYTGFAAGGIIGGLTLLVSLLAALAGYLLGRRAFDKTGKPA
jgi:hypothetical protein